MFHYVNVSRVPKTVAKCTADRDGMPDELDNDGYPFSSVGQLAASFHDAVFLLR